MARLAMTMRGMLAGLVLAALATGQALSAEAPAGAVTVSGPGGTMILTAAEIARLPAITISVSFGTMQGDVHATFAGPLLWTVLEQAGAVDPKKPRPQVSQTISVTGSDGYTAAFAVGEIAPDFEGKAVILADQMNAKPLGTDHLRIVVPGDRRGGRSVRDVDAIDVATIAPRAR